MAKVPVKYQCSDPRCQNGSIDWYKMCDVCDGDGWTMCGSEPVARAVCEGHGRVFNCWRPCGTCNGRGYEVAMEEACDENCYYDGLAYYINGSGGYQVIPGVGVVRLS